MKLTPTNPTDFNLMIETIKNQPLIYADYGRNNKSILTDENLLNKIHISESDPSSVHVLFYQSKYLNRTLTGYLDYDVNDGGFSPTLALNCYVLGNRNIKFVESLFYADALDGLTEAAQIICSSLGVELSSDRSIL